MDRKNHQFRTTSNEFSANFRRVFFSHLDFFSSTKPTKNSKSNRKATRERRNKIKICRKITRNSNELKVNFRKNIKKSSRSNSSSRKTSSHNKWTSNKRKTPNTWRWRRFTNSKVRKESFRLLFEMSREKYSSNFRKIEFNDDRTR